MLFTSILNGQPQKQLSVALNFPNERSPCDGASSQNSLRSCSLFSLYSSITQLPDIHYPTAIHLGKGCQVDSTLDRLTEVNITLMNKMYDKLIMT